MGMKKYYGKFINIRLSLIAASILVLIAILVFQSVQSQIASFVSTPSSSLSKRTSQMINKAYFVNKVLHWRQSNLDFTLHSTDPANGKEVFSDVWLQTGAQGQVIFYHSRYSLKDGTFLQDVSMNQTTRIFIQSKLYKTIVPVPFAPSWCINQQQIESDVVQSRLPSFIDESTLREEGYQLSGKNYIKSLPDTPLSIAARPVITYTLDNHLHTWVYEEKQSSSAPAVTLKSVMEVAPDGRLIWENNEVKNSSGTLLQSNWVALGPLYVYRSAVVPGSFLVMSSQQEKGECSK